MADLNLAGFTPAQIKLYYMLKRGVQTKRDMTGCNYYFLHDPNCRHRRYKGFKTKKQTFAALLNAGLLTLKATKYPWEIWELKT